MEAERKGVENYKNLEQKTHRRRKMVTVYGRERTYGEENGREEIMWRERIPTCYTNCCKARRNGGCTKRVGGRSTFWFPGGI